MNAVYNVAIVAVYGLLRLICMLGATRLMSPDSKLRKFMEGQSEALAAVSAAHVPKDSNTLWVHAASLGEYGIARPIIRRLKRATGCRVVMTFFSSTGYEALHSSVAKDADGPDYVFYLPLDTRHNVAGFLDIIEPKKAIFMVSEIWPNYLHALHRRGIPSCLVSAKVSERTAAMRWYGGMHRKAMQCFSKILVLDDKSRDMLNGVGMTNVVTTGNPLFDNVIGVADQPYDNRVLDAFCKGRRVFVAGSISDDNDLRLVTTLANRHADTRFIFVPHEITPANLQHVVSGLQGKWRLYTDCTPSTDFDAGNMQVLVVNTLGELSRLYRYGAYAYVGGGFTPYLHSIIEVSVYGLPVAFGPCTGRKVTPAQTERLGIGCKVADADELDRWFSRLKDNAPLLADIHDKARNYVYSNAGATDQVCREINEI